MIVAAVDDLLFSSKLRQAARGAGVEIVFARGAGAVLAQARATKPSLVILDLDAERLQPLDVLEQLRADATLADIRTLGFVSHVRADRIRAAEEAGIGAVLARSAFVAQLPDIVAGAR